MVRHLGRTASGLIPVQSIAPLQTPRHKKARDKRRLFLENGGAKRDRTADLLHAMQALSQLSYSPSTGARHINEPRYACQYFSLNFFS